ncbi:MAG: energy transducer TonB [Burkholderiaceae bacterium]|nr:energy transducer TonB [Burkholderiaceae bacterium]
MSHTTRLLIAAALGSLSFAAAAADSVASIDSKVPCDKPEYPRASLVNEEQGTVVLSLEIGTDGKVMDSKVEKSSGFKNLDKAALKLASCHFKPVVQDGKPVQSWAKFEYVWKLD